MANLGTTSLFVVEEGEPIANGKLIEFPPRPTSKRRKPSVKPTARQRKSLRENDLDISFPQVGKIAFHSPSRFSSWTRESVRRFVEISFGLSEIFEVEVDPFLRTATLTYHPSGGATSVMSKVSRLYRGDAPADASASFSRELFRAIPKTQPRLRAFRYGEAISIWEPRAESSGSIRLRNVSILGKRHLVRRLERELMGVVGIERFDVHPISGCLTVEFNAQVVQTPLIVAHLDAALCSAPRKAPKSSADAGLKIATVSLALSACATFVAPALLPVGMALMLYTAMPSFRRAVHVVKHERRLGVDVLDSIIFVACSFTGQIFAGAMTAWFLNLGRKLLEDTQAQSERMLLQAFGKQSATACVLHDGVEVVTPLEKIRPGDLVAVHTGEAVPVDGIISEGDAILDQHALTGESAPAEKTVGDKVFASTLLLAGKIIVSVEKAGKETAASKISEILTNTVAHKLRAQSRGEELADRAVIPTLAVALVAAGTVGPSSALAVINSEMGTGIRMAAPLGMMTSITRCSQNGILVKDGRALEIMRNVDTVLFDKTGTLTREKPEVHRIICCGDHQADDVLELAAAAEQKFSHPIARAILDRFSQLNRPIPALDGSKYKVGYGITVEIQGRTVRVGSRRFMDQEKISVPAHLESEMADLHADGHSFVCVAIEHELAGVLELQTSHRPEVEEIIAGLRARGVNHIAIISGDHDQPTRRLAEHLGMDRYFAEVLPQDKAKYVELLQKEGRTVCFIGDGINDSIALKKANVSISLRGASTIATDTAQIVFMEESLARVCDLIDCSEELERNVSRSWNLITIPNSLCIAGVFLFGFNIWHSVAFNNISAIAALLNGLLPLRQAAKVSRSDDAWGAEFRPSADAALS
jgi:heavy metal translocating P-type ATPase